MERDHKKLRRLRNFVVSLSDRPRNQESASAQRAQFTARRKAIYEALHPETRQGGAGKEAKSASFAADTATKTGQTERTVRLDATRGERISDEALNAVAGTAADKGVVLAC